MLLHSAAHQGDWSAEPEHLGDLWLVWQQQTPVAREDFVSHCREVRAAGVTWAGELGARSPPSSCSPGLLHLTVGGHEDPGCGHRVNVIEHPNIQSVVMPLMTCMTDQGLLAMLHVLVGRSLRLSAQPQ